MICGRTAGVMAFRIALLLLNGVRTLEPLFCETQKFGIKISIPPRPAREYS